MSPFLFLPGQIAPIYLDCNECLSAFVSELYLISLETCRSKILDLWPSMSWASILLWSENYICPWISAMPSCFLQVSINFEIYMTMFLDYS